MGGTEHDTIVVDHEAHNAEAEDSAAAEDRAATRRSREAATGQDWKDAAEPITTLAVAYIDKPVIGTLTLGAFLILKGYVLSKGSIPLALGIMQNAGLPTIVIGGLLSGLPILVAVMLAGTTFSALAYKGGQKKSVGGLPLSPKAIMALAAVALSLVFTQWPIMVIAAGIGLVLALIHRTSRPPVKIGVYLIALVLVVYGMTVMLYAVWLPREKLTITGVKTPVVGYVLSDTPDGWITILLSQQRGLVSYRDKDVTSRQTCQQAPYSIWSQAGDAATLWQEITRWGPLSFLQAPTEPLC